MNGRKRPPLIFLSMVSNPPCNRAAGFLQFTSSRPQGKTPCNGVFVVFLPPRERKGRPIKSAVLLAFCARCGGWGFAVCGRRDGGKVRLFAAPFTPLFFGRFGRGLTVYKKVVDIWKIVWYYVVDGWSPLKRTRGKREWRKVGLPFNGRSIQRLCNGTIVVRPFLSYK